MPDNAWQYPGGDTEESSGAIVGGAELEAKENGEVTPEPGAAVVEPTAPEPPRVPNTVQRDARRYKELTGMLNELGATEDQIRNIHKGIKEGTFQFPQPVAQPNSPQEDDDLDLRGLISSELRKNLEPLAGRVNAVASRLDAQENDRQLRQTEKTFADLTPKYPAVRGKILEAAIREYRENPDITPEEVMAAYNQEAESYHKERIDSAKKAGSKLTPTISSSGAPQGEIPKLEGKTSKRKLDEIADLMAEKFAKR